MTHAHIQLPDELFKEVQRIAREQDWTVEEVLRHGTEAFVRHFSTGRKDVPGWQMPQPLEVEVLMEDASQWRDLARRDESSRF